MRIAFLIVHGLVAAALLGALTHQAVAAFRQTPRGTSFMSRYASVGAPSFRNAVIILYVISCILGAVLYPAYRLDARVPLEEMRMGWAIGLFELKEHFGGIGLAALPLYAYSWNPARTFQLDRIAITLTLAFITWFNFIAGHVINNIRGL